MLPKQSTHSEHHMDVLFLRETQYFADAFLASEPRSVDAAERGTEELFAPETLETFKI